jgi:hypothetical protein
MAPYVCCNVAEKAREGQVTHTGNSPSYLSRKAQRAWLARKKLSNGFHHIDCCGERRKRA